MPEGAVGVAAFRGAVRCRRDPAGPLEITLEGRAAGEAGAAGEADAAGEPLTVAFSGATDPGLPDALEAAVVEQVGPARYRIAAGARDWLIEAAAVHLHRDVGRAFYQALPPRPAPFARRLGFRLALRLARSRAGLAVLRALRG
jgi:hypothetical protein